MGPISVVHRLIVKPGRLAEVRRLMTIDYPASVAAHGVKLTCALGSPVEPPGQPTDLLVVLEYENVDAFWAERGANLSAGPAIALFWEQIDELVEWRERRLLTAEPVPWSPPSNHRSVSRLPRGLHRTMLMLAPLDTTAPAAWLNAIEMFSQGSADVMLSSAGFHVLQGSASLPAHLTWDIVSTRSPDMTRLVGGLPGPAVVAHAINLVETVSLSVTAPHLSGFKRVILLKVTPGQEQRLETSLLAILGSTDRIRNWSHSRVDPASDPAGWTHAFEMEFETLADLRGDYRQSPYHWDIGDSPFHPQAPQKAGTGYLTVIYPINRSVLGRL